MEFEKNKLLSTSDADLNIGKIFRVLLMQSKLILFITLVGSSIGLIYYFSSEKQFKINSLVQILPNENQQFSPNLSGLTDNLTLGSANTSDINTLQRLYLSRSNITAVIRNTKSNIKIEGLNSFDKEFIKQFEILDEEKNNKTINFNDDGWLISDEKGIDVASSNYGVLFSNQKFLINMEKPNSGLIDGSFRMNLYTPEQLYRNFVSKINITSPSSSAYLRSTTNGAIIEISLTTNDVEDGINLLDVANQNFITKSIEVESEQARKALNFLELRSFELESQLENKKLRLKEFREQNKTVDVNLEIESILGILESLDQKINQIDIDIEKARNDFTESNPIYVSLQSQKQTLLNQKNDIQNRIESLPVSQQQYIDLYRDVEISQEIFNELQNRKLEFSIKEASTLGNMRVVDSAYLEYMVSPQFIIVVISAVVSLLLSMFIAIIRGLYFIPISNPAEIEDNGINIPITGVVAKISDDSDENDILKNALESLIVNIDTGSKSEGEQAETIVITSPSSENGKSYITRNIALTLGKLGKKVLLMDADYKRGDQHIFLNKGKITVKDFFNINENNIENYKVEDNTFLIPKIRGMNSSFQFLYDKKFQEKVDFFKKNFDYIIVDTAPILSVSDTLILLSQGDQVFLVARHGKNTINEIRQSISLFNQVGIVPNGIIYNSYERPSSYYGYYELYGNYSYQYYAKRYLYEAYNYEDEKD